MMLQRESQKCMPSLQAELHHDIGAVVLDGARGDRQHSGDFPVGHDLAKQLQNSLLGSCQRILCAPHSVDVAGTSLDEEPTGA